MYGKARDLDTLKTDKSGNWGPTRQQNSLYQLSGYGYADCKLSFHDDFQKEFQFLDMFKTSFFYVILIIVGFVIFIWKKYN